MLGLQSTYISVLANCSRFYCRNRTPLGQRRVFITEEVDKSSLLCLLNVYLLSSSVIANKSQQIIITVEQTDEGHSEAVQLQCILTRFWDPGLSNIISVMLCKAQ